MILKERFSTASGKTSHRRQPQEPTIVLVLSILQWWQTLGQGQQV